MIERIRAATDAVDRFLNNIHQDDDVFLMTFSGKISLEQDFTDDRRKLSRAMKLASLSGAARCSMTGSNARRREGANRPAYQTRDIGCL
jgi:hypothetical protein